MQSIVQLSGPVPTMWWSMDTAFSYSLMSGLHLHLSDRVCLCPESSTGYTWIKVFFCFISVLVLFLVKHAVDELIDLMGYSIPVCV